MLKRCLMVTLLTFALLFHATNASACTTFFLQGADAKLFGRNYDWDLAVGRVIVNPSGLKKRAFSFEKPAEWTSRYGSVTFNQYGREFPCDGMNEAGLVVAVMWLGGTSYPPKDDRPTVTSLQWVQQQLDTAGTVKEVVASAKQTRVVALGAYLHYLVADATGDCAAIEFIDGKMVVHQGKQMPYSTLTNTPYADAVDTLSDHKGFGGHLEMPKSGMSVDRFIRGACSVRDVKDGQLTCESRTVFKTLENVAQGGFTKWSICYDLTGKKIEFRTRDSPKIKQLAFSKLEFANPDQPLSVDLGVSEPGDVTGRFTAHTREENRRLIDQAFDGTSFLQSWPKSARAMLAVYPYTAFTPVEQEQQATDVSEDQLQPAAAP